MDLSYLLDIQLTDKGCSPPGPGCAINLLSSSICGQRLAAAPCMPSTSWITSVRSGPRAERPMRRRPPYTMGSVSAYVRSACDGSRLCTRNLPGIYRPRTYAGDTPTGRSSPTIRSGSSSTEVRFPRGRDISGTNAGPAQQSGDAVSARDGAAFPGRAGGTLARLPHSRRGGPERRPLRPARAGGTQGDRVPGANQHRALRKGGRDRGVEKASRPLAPCKTAFVPDRLKALVLVLLGWSIPSRRRISR
jgi:hypothetical protein